MDTHERSFVIKYFQLDRTRFSSWKVAFTIFHSPIVGHRDWCVYTGIKTPEHLRSSINVADEIITGILKEEELNFRHVRFFDLQTYRYYEKDSGEFEFDEVLGYDPDEKYQSLHWRPIECPSEIREVFHEFIGEGIPRTPRQKAIDRLEALRVKIKWPEQ